MALGLYLTHRLKCDAGFSLSLLSACLFLPHLKFSAFSWVSISESSSVYLAVFGTAATLLGFVIASFTFLITHMRSREFQIIRESRSYGQFLSICRSAMWRLAVLMIVSGIASRSLASFLPLLNCVIVFASSYAATA